MNQEKILKTITKTLLAREDIVAAYAYGSILTDYFKKESDIDIAVQIKRPFEPEDLFEMQNDLASVVLHDVSIIEISNNISIILRNEIARKGQLLFTKDEAVSDVFLIKTPQFFEDFMFLHKELEKDYIARNLNDQ